MVNDNHHSRGPRMPFEPDDPGYRLRPNPAWRKLQVGDMVRPNLRGRRLPAPPRHGKIMGIEDQIANVRWQDRSESAFQLRYLVKV